MVTVLHQVGSGGQGLKVSHSERTKLSAMESRNLMDVVESMGSSLTLCRDVLVVCQVSCRWTRHRKLRERLATSMLPEKKHLNTVKM